MFNYVTANHVLSVENGDDVQSFFFYDRHLSGNHETLLLRAQGDYPFNGLRNNLRTFRRDFNLYNRRDRRVFLTVGSILEPTKQAKKRPIITVKELLICIAFFIAGFFTVTANAAMPSINSAKYADSFSYTGKGQANQQMTVVTNQAGDHLALCNLEGANHSHLEWRKVYVQQLADHYQLVVFTREATHSDIKYIECK